MPDTRTWVIRAGRDAVHFDEFRSKSIAGMGWGEAGPITTTTPDRELDERFARAFPSAREGTRRVWQAQVRRFVHEVSPGDRVGTYNPSERLYLLGTIAGNIEWRDGVVPRVRRVEWTHQVLRDQLSISTRNSLGSIATLFQPSEAASNELWDKAAPLGSIVVDPPRPLSGELDAADAELDDTTVRDDVVERAQQFIEDRIAALDWKQMQELVAGILRAMGYHTHVSAEGADRGVDIFASPDGLGLQEPRIFVEVKHRSGSMSADEVRAFLGGRRPGDRCLYVSTGGFTKDARYEADRSNVPLMLITLPKLRELLIQHYERLDAEVRALVPLQRLYWPIG